MSIFVIYLYKICDLDEDTNNLYPIPSYFQSVIEDNILQNMRRKFHSLGIFVINLLISYAISELEIITKEPYAVTPYFPGLKHLYLQLRHADPEARSRLNPQLKWEICKKIFNRRPPLFNSPEELFELLLDPKILESMLKNDYRYQSIFLDVFEKYRPRMFHIPMPGKRPYRYVNRSKLRPIYVDGNLYYENTFLCLVGVFKFDAKNKPIPSKRIIRQYYVSDSEYNVNEVTGNDQIIGRFVFYYDQEIQHLVVHALAEESPPIIDEQSNLVYSYLAWYYLEKRHLNKPTFDPRDDPICKLDESQKLRICNSVLLEMQKMITAQVVVDDDCVKRSLRFKGESEDFFDEWTISCGLVPLSRYDQISPSTFSSPVHPNSLGHGTTNYSESATPSRLGSPTSSYPNSTPPSCRSSPTPGYLNSPTSSYFHSPTPSYFPSPDHSFSSGSSPSHSGLSSHPAPFFSHPGSFSSTDLSNYFPSSSNSRPFFELYVSRAYTDNEVFLLMPDADTRKNINWLYGYKRKLSVVRDRQDRHSTKIIEGGPSSAGSNNGNGDTSSNG